jgi:hypothetical protein
MHGKQQRATTGRPLQAHSGVAGHWALSLSHGAVEEQPDNTPHDQPTCQVYQQVQTVEELRIKWDTICGLKG